MSAATTDSGLRETVLDSDKATILVVDDTPENLSLMGDVLSPFYRVRVAINGERAPWESNPWVWSISFRVVS